MATEMERFLVTGAGGCIGAWTVRLLAREGTAVTAFDVSEDRHRLRLVLDEERWGDVSFRTGDVRDLSSLLEVVSEEGITHIVHLAALQVPFCKADPPLGAQVNVVGTVNVLEARRRRAGQVRGLSYASSVAVFGPAAAYPAGTVQDDSALAPATLYGAYKQANESTARIYAADWGVGSVGLRPSVVYGPGRDQGLTSDPTTAMLAAAAGGGFHVAFGGVAGFQHAEDVARCFIAAARVETTAALVHNIGCRSAPVARVVELIEEAAPAARGRITIDETPLPLPRDLDGSPLERLIGVAARQRPLEEGVAETVAEFRRLLAAGLVAPPG